MAKTPFNHPKRVIIKILVSGQAFKIRHEPDEWHEDPLRKFKALLQTEQMRLFTLKDGRSIWIRPCDISAYMAEGVR